MVVVLRILQQYPNLFFQHHAKLLHLNVSPFDGLKQDGILLQADARAGLQALQQALIERNFRTSTAYQHEIKSRYDSWQKRG